MDAHELVAPGQLQDDATEGVLVDRLNPARHEQRPVRGQHQGGGGAGERPVRRVPPDELGEHLAFGAVAGADVDRLTVAYESLGAAVTLALKLSPADARLTRQGDGWA